MSDFNWSDFEVESEFPDAFKFLEVGDAIAGTITKTKRATMPDGTVLPELWIRNHEGVERSVLVSQRDLQAKLSEARPKVGDDITITLERLGKPKPGKNPAKLFAVTLTGQDKTPATNNADTTSQLLGDD
jgi:hypothetical protein